MLIPIRFLRNVRHCLTVITAFLICLAGYADVFGQPSSLRDRVYKNQKKSLAPKKTNKVTPQIKKTTPPPVKKTAPPVKPVTQTAKKTLVKNSPLFVTFMAKEPMVEVWLDGKVIGYTDGRFQLSKKIAPGEYSLMAKNQRQVFLTTRRIKISQAQTSFKLYVETAEVPKMPPPVENPQPQPQDVKSEIDAAIEVSRKVREILENYLNPETTDSVTTEDWQIVFQGSRLGELQGYTAVEMEAQRWFASGQIELAQKQFANALTAFNKAQEFMPGSALPFYAMGNTYFANQQFNDAFKLYQKALQLDRKLAMAYKKLGDTQRLLNKDREAITAYRYAIQFGYRTPETRFWLGTLMLENKQIEQGIEILETVAKEMPTAQVFLAIGTGYEKLKRDVSAIEYYGKAVEADPSSAVAHYKLANVYLNQRENDKAKTSLEKAITLDPNGTYVNRTEAQKKLREVSSKLNR